MDALEEILGAEAGRLARVACDKPNSFIIFGRVRAKCRRVFDALAAALPTNLNLAGSFAPEGGALPGCFAFPPEQPTEQMLRAALRQDPDGFLMASLPNEAVDIFCKAVLTGHVLGTTLIADCETPKELVERWQAAGVSIELIQMVMAQFVGVDVGAKRLFRFADDGSQIEALEADLRPQIAAPRAEISDQPTFSIGGLGLIEPNWLTKTEWFGGLKDASREVEIEDHLNGGRQKLRIEARGIGRTHFPSGQMVAASSILDADAFFARDVTGIEVPRESCEVRTVTIGRELAYLSFVWRDLRDLRRAVIVRDAPVPTRDGIFFVDKYILSVIDIEELRTHHPEGAEFENYLDVSLERINAGGPIEAAPHGWIVRTPSGIAAAVLEFDDQDQVGALHFDFFLLHSTGEDGEYD